MKQFTITGRATDGSGDTIEGTLTVNVNEPPRSLAITVDIPEPGAGYEPGTVVTYTLSAQDDDALTYSMDVAINGVAVPLPLKAGSINQFLFTVPA
jgi:hypothetical protein